MVYASDETGNPLNDFSLYCFIFAYNEEDIIESTIKNAFIQGCDKVFFVDHMSDDSTLDLATKSGAIIYDIYKSRVWLF